MGVIGLLLIVGRPADAVWVQDGSLHVGATTLHLVSQSPVSAVYAGDAVYRLTVGGSGVEVDAAWSSNGVDVSASCVESNLAGSVAADCTCMVPGLAPLTWRDTFDPAHHAWHRLYGDGARADIEVPAGTTAVPVAFPMGR